LGRAGNKAKVFMQMIQATLKKLVQIRFFHKKGFTFALEWSKIQAEINR
jgi:hypothetical protein